MGAFAGFSPHEELICTTLYDSVLLCTANLPDYAPPYKTAGAGEGNRTLVVSLEGFCSTIELHPPDSSRLIPIHAGVLVEKVGFEPT